MLASLGHPS